MRKAFYITGTIAFSMIILSVGLFSVFKYQEHKEHVARVAQEKFAQDSIASTKIDTITNLTEPVHPLLEDTVVDDNRFVLTPEEAMKVMYEDGKISREDYE